jgi:hypothetical protein
MPPVPAWFSRLMQTSSRLMPILLLVSAALLVVGCMRGGPQKKVCYPVRGELTVAGKPADGATVILQPKEANRDEWSDGFPRATVAADGKFQVSTYGENDGAPAGDYIILVSWVVPNPANEEASGPDRLGGRYIEPDKSKLTATVEPRPTELPPIRLP